MNTKDIDNKDKQVVMSQDYTLEDINRIEDFREALLHFEEQLASVEGSYCSAENAGQEEVMNKTNPLTHTFGDGFYMREISRIWRLQKKTIENQLKLIQNVVLAFLLLEILLSFLPMKELNTLKKLQN